MTFLTGWIHEPYILGTDFTELTSVGDVNMAMLEYLGAIQEQEMYFLMDFTATGDVPGELLKLPSMLQVVTHANTRWIAIVKPEKPGSASSTMTQMLARDKIKTFRDRQTALAFLRSMVRLDTGIEIRA